MILLPISLPPSIFASHSLPTGNTTKSANFTSRLAAESSFELPASPDFTIPNSPAATMLGINPSEVKSVGSLNELASNIYQGFDRSGRPTQGFAYSTAIQGGSFSVGLSKATDIANGQFSLALGWSISQGETDFRKSPKFFKLLDGYAHNGKANKVTNGLEKLDSMISSEKKEAFQKAHQASIGLLQESPAWGLLTDRKFTSNKEVQDEPWDEFLLTLTDAQNALGAFKIAKPDQFPEAITVAIESVNNARAVLEDEANARGLKYGPVNAAMSSLTRGLTKDVRLAVDVFLRSPFQQENKKAFDAIAEEVADYYAMQRRSDLSIGVRAGSPNSIFDKITGEGAGIWWYYQTPGGLFDCTTIMASYTTNIPGKSEGGTEGKSSGYSFGLRGYSGKSKSGYFLEALYSQNRWDFGSTDIARSILLGYETKLTQNGQWLQIALGNKVTGGQQALLGLNFGWNLGANRFKKYDPPKQTP